MQITRPISIARLQNNTKTDNNAIPIMKLIIIHIQFQYQYGIGCMISSGISIRHISPGIGFNIGSNISISCRLGIGCGIRICHGSILVMVLVSVKELVSVFELVVVSVAVSKLSVVSVFARY